MAQYEHLPIYLKAMEVAVYFENTVRHFSRYQTAEYILVCQSGV